MKKKTIIIVVAVVVVLGLMMSMCGKKGGNETKAAKAVKGDMLVNVSVAGTIHSDNEAKLSTVASGRVRGIYVKENETVKKGTLILDLDSNPQAEKDYRRLASLGEKGFVSSQQVEQAKEMWENSRVTAPFNGTLAKQFVEPGEMLIGGSPAVMLADLQDLILVTNIDETDIGQVKVGQKAAVELDAYKDAKLTGRVQFIARSSLEIKEKGITYEVKIRLDPADVVMRLGMTGNVDVLVDEKKNVLMIPYTAVGEEKKEKVVFAVEKGKLKKKTVVTGLENYDSTEIVSGLAENDEVIYTYSTKMKEGQKIKTKL